MKTMQGTSTPKFVRKSSQSPWDPTCTTITVHAPITKEENATNTITITPNKNVYTINQRRDSNLYIRTLQSSLVSVTDKQGIRIGGQLGLRRENLVQQYGNSNENSKNPQNDINQQISLTISNVQSLESLPTIRKKISDQFDNNYIQTKRKQSQIYQNIKDNGSQQQEIDKYKQCITKLETDNRTLIENLQNKKNQVNKLMLQISNVKISHMKLQTQNIGLRNCLRDLESKLGSVKMQCQNQKNKNNELEMRKKKEEDRNRELQFAIRKLELQISAKKQQIRQLNAIIQSSSVPKLISQGVGTSKAKIYSTQSQSGVYVQRCNRFIQTQSSNYQHTLKQLQNTQTMLKNKQKHIKNQQKQIHTLNKRVKILDELQHTHTQQCKLIESLDLQISKAYAVKLANKYKYF